MLEKVKVGDKVKFKAVTEEGRNFVTELQLAR
jgi:Cu/Ag efflux protein CusF